MNDFLVCDECNKGEINFLQEENKIEEYICIFCKHGEAECLVDGQPTCVTCKMNKKNQHKSPAGSIRSNNSSSKQSVPKKRQPETPKSGVPKNMADQLKQCIDICNHKRGDSSVSVEFFKAHKFLQKYTNHNFNELVLLYKTINDGFKASTFHTRCDDCKNGLVIIVSLSLGYEIGAFTWKGIRKGIPQANDPQMGGAFIRADSFEFVPFKDNIVFSLQEGIRFGSDNDLYLNFDAKEKSICNFDPRLKGNTMWTTYIENVSVYKLQVLE
ncbi:hypothetical protein SteCoe_15104 [Stentor coeruleus]|uniref:TLDc domain-containing protein n=1 Tax=Stentor coeruleus TaxID=5963 RepID=A0A1R2C4F6_9CILI|nr:hypothetical protein SteCoe_15104 [Stentor coeruleus]